MADKVMQRVYMLIYKQSQDIQEFLRDVIDIEKSYLSESGVAAIPKIHSRLKDSIRNRPDNDQ